jgi:hypothetical protein
MGSWSSLDRGKRRSFVWAVSGAGEPPVGERASPRATDGMAWSPKGSEVVIVALSSRGGQNRRAAHLARRATPRRIRRSGISSIEPDAPQGGTATLERIPRCTTSRPALPHACRRHRGPHSVGANQPPAQTLSARPLVLAERPQRAARQQHSKWAHEGQWPLLGACAQHQRGRRRPTADPLTGARTRRVCRHSQLDRLAWRALSRVVKRYA